MLAAVRNDRVQFVTIRPKGSRFAVLERRIIVTGPPELIELAKVGDKHVLDDLIKMLKDPERGWAAFILLAAMTRIEEKIADTFATNTDSWWESAGKTAYERWNSWFNEVREKLVWDPDCGVFVEKEQGVTN